MNVCAIMATCGRHTLAERSLRFFLDQQRDKDKVADIYHLLIYNNSDVEYTLNPSVMDGVEGFKIVELINQHIDSKTGERYTNLGAIYNDALTHMNSADVIVHWDDDDIFLPNHIMKGMEGLWKAIDIGSFAYKPEKSYYRHPGGVELMGNNLEPSVFVLAEHVRDYGYSLTTSDQHMPWFQPLISESKMFIDSKGTPTLIYNWGDTDIPTFKTSGNAGSPQNFDNYRNFSKDHGDRVLTPWSREDVQKYYNLIK